MTAPSRRTRCAAAGLLAAGALTAGLLLSGCASNATRISPAAQQDPAPASPTPATAGSMSMARTGPTATALMVCSDDIKGKVRQVVKLPADPPTRSTFADQLYTCTYTLPAGPLVLSVQHSPDRTAALAYFDGLRRRLGTTETLDGLGEKSYGTPTGVAVVLKDNETLMVDATKLPPVFGADQQRRTDLADEIASDVLGCWTGDE